jgi:hypothetical protein
MSQARFLYKLMRKEATKEHRAKSKLLCAYIVKDKTEQRPTEMIGFSP